MPNATYRHGDLHRVLLADALTATGGDLLAMGEAYVRFAVGHRAHFEVMFQPDLYRTDNPALTAVRSRVATSLRGGITGHTKPDIHQRHATTAAWSIAHGFATLWLSGALQPTPDDDVTAAARPVLRPPDPYCDC